MTTMSVQHSNQGLVEAKRVRMTLPVSIQSHPSFIQCETISPLDNKSGGVGGCRQ